MWRVECDNCGSNGPLYHSDDEAVEAWNTRPADQDRVEAARQAMMMLIRNEDAGLERIEGLAIRLGVDLYNSSK